MNNYLHPSFFNVDEFFVHKNGIEEGTLLEQAGVNQLVYFHGVPSWYITHVYNHRLLYIVYFMYVAHSIFHFLRDGELNIKVCRFWQDANLPRSSNEKKILPGFLIWKLVTQLTT